MSVIRKVKRVQGLYGQLEVELSGFQQKTGLHCLLGCGHCCTKPDIEAAVLEFLPFAFQLYLERRAESFKTELSQHQSSICKLYKSLTVTDQSFLKGQCGEYAYRGLICRLFGFATTRDKNGQRILSTCKWIKGTQQEKLDLAKPLIAEGMAPHYINYYQRLAQIDFKLGQQYLPVNDAILAAIEEVEHYYQYRPFPYRLRKIA